MLMEGTRNICGWRKEKNEEEIRWIRAFAYFGSNRVAGS